MPDVLVLRPKSVPLLDEIRNDRVVLLGTLFRDWGVLLLDKLDRLLVHERLHIPNQRVVLTLYEGDLLLQECIQIRALYRWRARAYLTRAEDCRSFVLCDHACNLAIAAKPTASKLRWKALVSSLTTGERGHWSVPIFRLIKGLLLHSGFSEVGRVHFLREWSGQLRILFRQVRSFVLLFADF